MKNTWVIAVDGYSSCGKSTLAKDLAKSLDITFIDSGAMYRAVTLFALEQGLIKEGRIEKEQLIKQLEEIDITFEQKDSQREIYLNGKNVEKAIRELAVAKEVSRIAEIKEVREKLVDLQRKMSQNQSVVMDGRDIGTVVFPHADLKLFMTADKTIRAQRRYKELVEKNPNITIEEVTQNIEERDFIDENRSESPLRQAADALVLDNSKLTREEQLEFALGEIKKIKKQAAN